MANPSIMDSFFQRSLEDLIRGIRLQASDSSAPTSPFFSKSMEEIRREIKSTDPHTKSTALLKLTYLHTLYGFDMSWAAFHVVEVVSYPQFPLKKIGYLAASLSFHEDTEVILLATNQLRKDLSSPNEFDVSLALNCLSVVATTDLSRDLCNDLFTLLSSTRIYVKKKAIALVLRVFNKYPDSVRVCFKRLVENLDSSDPHLLASAVGVFCELTLQDPKAYLPLAPEFYRVLVDCKNNWVVIKVLKIFAKLAPLEPRLAKKLVDPICEILKKTTAKSMALECIKTIITSMSDYESAVKLAVAKVKEFLVEFDPNLKYIGLQVLSGLTSRHLWAVLESKEIVIKSLSDADPNIKLEALRLLMSMVCEDNVVEFCRILVNYALKSDSEFCNEILGSILATCSSNYYEIVMDFDWYVSLLGEMSRIPNCQRGEEIEIQLIDIGMRVKDVRPELVQIARNLLIDPALLGNPFLHSILSACAWVSGEYVEFTKKPFELIESLLQPRSNLLPPSIRGIYIHSAFKVLVFILQSYYFQDDAISLSAPVAANEECAEEGSILSPGDFTQSVKDDADSSTGHGQSSLSHRQTVTHESIVNLLNLIEVALRPLLGSHLVEVHDRTRNLLGLIDLVKDQILDISVVQEVESGKEEVEVSKIIELVYDSIAEDLGPVSAVAKSKVPVPDGLELCENLIELDQICGSDVESTVSSSFSLLPLQSDEREAYPSANEPNEDKTESLAESTTLLAQHRKKHGLYYLPSEKEVTSNEYPPANEANSSNTCDDVNDLVKLTETSYKKKSKKAMKPRPMVVKLDEYEGSFVPEKMLFSDDHSISGAVRDILLGNDDIVNLSSSRGGYTSPKLSSSKSRGKEKLGGDSREISGNAGEDGNVGKTSSSRSSKIKGHGKERRHSKSNAHYDEEGKIDNGKDGKKKKSRQHHHRKHKDERGAQEGKKKEVVLQASVVPDFLL